MSFDLILQTTKHYDKLLCCSVNPFIHCPLSTEKIPYLSSWRLVIGDMVNGRPEYSACVLCLSPTEKCAMFVKNRRSMPN